MKATRAQAIFALNTERDYQDAKGSKAHGSIQPKALEQYAYYMEDYLRQLKQQITGNWGPDANERSGALDTMRKITALGLAAMEEHGAPLRVVTAADMVRGLPTPRDPDDFGQGPSLG